MKLAIIAFYVIATGAALIVAVSGAAEGTPLATLVVAAAVVLAALPLIVWLGDRRRREAVSSTRLLVTYAVSGIATTLSIFVFDGSLIPTALVMGAVGALYTWTLGSLLGADDDRVSRSQRGAAA